MGVRIGIDVGGTFTDAVAIDNETFELIGTVKIPTTHAAAEGVAAGIIQALNLILAKYNLSPEDVVFIAHGTTQATNALLEGDVEQVGILGLGKGIEGMKVKTDTNIEAIELAAGRFLHTHPRYLEMNEQLDDNIHSALAGFKSRGIEVVVVSAAYSVDDPTVELSVKEAADRHGVLSTASHEISKLYGLKIRTRTAVINASILPRMMQTATMTESSVHRAAINAPLMIMRCDGGVMSAQEVKKRPILTMLSGPAAGVAGALMYEKISEGIFLEVGGTSTDISAIHNGQVMVDYAEVGGHKTYVNSLDVRTVGIAGGSMIRAGGGDIIDVGPRSAHIAGLGYLVYANAAEIGDLEIVLIQPKKDDYHDYVAVRDKESGKLYALTLACAANAAGYVQADHYAKGDSDLALKGFAALAAYLGLSVAAVLHKTNVKAAVKNKKVVQQLIQDYNLEADQLVLVGGGGGAAAVVPYLAEELNMKYRIARNAEVISPIGVALAMVRDIVERTVVNPTEDDIKKIRKEAEQAALKAGATAGTIEIVVEVDPRKNLVRATATGTTEMRTGDRKREEKTTQQLRELAAESLAVSPADTKIAACNGEYYVFQAELTKKVMLGLLKTKVYPLRLLTKEGVIRLQAGNARVAATTVADCEKVLKQYLGRLSEYGEGGEKIPEVYLFVGARFIDLSRLVSSDQVIALHRVELAGEDGGAPVIIIFALKGK